MTNVIKALMWAKSQNKYMMVGELIYAAIAQADMKAGRYLEGYNSDFNLRMNEITNTELAKALDAYICPPETAKMFKEARKDWKMD